MADMISRGKNKKEKDGQEGALSPFKDFPSLLRRLRSEFDELFQHAGGGRLSPSGAGIGQRWDWGINIEDKDDSVVLRAEAPGFEADDFDIRISEDRVVLRAVKKVEQKKEGEEYLEQRECYESIMLPPGIDKDKGEARYRNGVLTVTIPKTQEGKSKRISVTGD